MRFVLTGLLAVVATTAMQRDAQAAFTVTLSVTGFASQTITDGGANDMDARTNFIGAQGSIDGYAYQVSANTNPPNGGFLGQFVVQQNILVTANTATAGPLTVTTFADTFTTGSASPVTLQVFNALGQTNFDLGSASGTTTVTPPGGVNGTTPPATLTGGGIVASSQTTTKIVVSSNPFSISNTMTITGLTNAGNATVGPQFNGSLTSTALPTQVTPAPAGIVLALTALPLFGLLRRRWGADKAVPTIA